MTDPIAKLRQQLRKLQQRHDSGALDAGAYEAAKAPLERQLVDAVMAASHAGASAPGAGQAGAAPPAPAPRAPVGLWAGAAALVLAVAATGYFLTGTPGAVGETPTGFGADAAEGGASAPHAVSADQIEALLSKLTARLKEQPDDVEGWMILGRSYMALNRYADASAAYQRAQKLRPDDATILADVADVTAVVNNRSLEGEPTKLLDRALKLEPDNLKALVLSGTGAFNRGDFAGAVKFWDHAIAVGPADSPMVEMARGGAAEARERGKLPPAPAASGAALAAAPAATPAAEAQPAATGPVGEVTGTIRLSAALKAQTSPDDPVFIYARAAEGSRMPLAILRKQVKDLPLNFKLDDTMAMSPGATMSAAGRIVVSARVSKSGQAQSQPGDLEGLSAPIAVGARDVVVEIGTKVP